MQDLSRRALLGFLGAGAVTLLGVSASEAQVVITERAMPPMRVEIMPPPPRPGVHWAPGHWVWRRGWVWVPGRYQRRVVRVMPAPLAGGIPPRPGPRYALIRGHWTWSDRRGDWVWIRPHWVR